MDKDNAVKIHILLVDDEEDTVVIFEYHFKHWIREGKARLSFSTSADEAIKSLDESNGNDIILILSDVNMPGMDGFEFITTVTTKYPHIKSILISAYSTPEYYDKADQAGAKKYFIKPVDFEELTKYIESEFGALKA